MEGMPRMPMLSVELKFSPSSTDFGAKFKEYIARVYQENPDEYTREIEELNQLRENAIKAPADFTGCSALKKYFAQLYLLLNRFPMEGDDSAAVPFTWYEKFPDMPSPITHEDVRYELACILHNIGAVHSYLATVDSRLTSDGMKVSCTHFQCATWAFQVLRDNTEPYRFSASHFSSDFDRYIMDWYAILMLAQAQECILEKSLVDNRKAHIVAKVATQVAEYYAQAIRVLEEPSVSDIVGSSKCRSWRKFIEMKRRLYRAIAFYELGTQANEQQKMGERLAYFQAASSELAEATKLGHKESSETIQQSLQFVEDVVVACLTQAQKENDFIYHEKIPTLDSLPELKGASLVKAIPFDPLNSDITGGDIFKRLIPLEVHRAASLYSEEKAKLLRRVSDDVDAKNASLEEFMDSLKVDQLMLDTDFGQITLPESLIELCATMNARTTAVKDLMERMSKLTSSYESVEKELLEIEKKIDEGDKATKDILAQVHGISGNDQTTKWPNDVREVVMRLKGFRDELERYRRAHEQATKANDELHKVLNVHTENLNMLSLPLTDLKKQLPVPPSDFATSPETMEMKRLLAKVDEMKRQRDTLVEQLRQQIRDDDVTKVLLAAKDKDEQVIFSNEMKKHEKQVSIIEQNLSAQENILKALTETNAKFGEMRRQVTMATKQRDAKIRSLVMTFDVFSGLESNAKEGIEFYDKLTKSLQELSSTLSKWNEEQFQTFCSESKAKLEKNLAAIEAQKLPVASTSTTMVNDPSGPKLKDYMAYYRAKKAGQAATFPQTGPDTMFPSMANSGTVAGGHSSMAPGVFPTYTNVTGHAVNGVSRYGGIDPTAHVNMTLPNTSFAMPTMGETFPTMSAFPAATSNLTPAMATAPAPISAPTPYSVPVSVPFSPYAVPGTTIPSTVIGTGGQYMTSGTMVPTMPGSSHHLAHHPSMGTYSVSATNEPLPSAVPVSGGYFQQNGTGVITSMPNYPYTAANSNPNMMINQTPSPFPAPTSSVQRPSGTFAAPMPSIPSMVSLQASSGGHVQSMPAQFMPSGYQCSGIFLEAVAFGSNYVQLRWRYDGPKPAKYMVTFRGYQRYDAGMGRFEDREVDTGAPVKLDVEHHIVYNLNPDTQYAFEVSVIDEASGRIIVRSQTVRVTTNSSLL